MKVIRKRKQIKAYGTPVSPARSLEQIQRKVEIHKCRWIGCIQNPANPVEKILSFQIPTRQGYLNVRIDVPEIHEQMAGGKTRYREKESYRYLLLLVEAKLALVELGEPIEESFLLDIMVDKERKMRELITKDLPLLTQGKGEK